MDPMSKVRRARLDQAVKELLDFQGSRGPILQATDGVDVETAKKKRQSNTAASKIARDFLRQGEIIETVGRLVEKCEETLGKDLAAYEELGIIITPSSEDSKSGDRSAASGSGKPGINIIDSMLCNSNTDQGVDKPTSGKAYTVLNDLTPTNTKGSKTVDDGVPEFHIIQVMNPEHTPASLNTEICTVAMNQLPTVELSKAVPFLNIEFLANEGVKAAGKANKTRGITTSRFLLGKNLGEKSKYRDFVLAEFLPVTDFAESDPESESVIAGMDLFTSPQTMVPVDAFEVGTKSYKDPFRPFMSIDSFVLTANSPKYGMDPNAADVSATIEIILHDRARLQDIQELVTPGGFSAGGRMRITYGFAHPDGSFARPSDAQKQKALYGQIIDGLRVSELFNVYSSEFNMTEDGEVKITVSAMSNSSETGFAALNITDAWDGSATFTEIARKFKELKYLITDLSARDNMKEIVVPTIFGTNGDIGGSAIDKKTLATITSYINAIVAKTADTEATQTTAKIKEISDALFKDTKGDLSIAKASTNRESVLKSILTYLRYSPDPFGRPMMKGTPSVTNIKPTRGFTDKQVQTGKAKTRKETQKKHVTFGKALAALIGIPMQKAYAGKAYEIQMIFYGFNDSAGGVQDYNIASFPIQYDDLEKVLTSEFKKNTTLSLGQVLSLLNSNFLQKEDSPAYGVGNIPKNVTQQQALNEMYGLKPIFPHSEFRLPQIGVSLRSFTGTADGNNPNKTIIRIEIYDARCGVLSASRRLLKAASRDGFFYSFSRQTQKPSPGKHSAGMNHEKRIAEAEKVIEPYLADVSKTEIEKALKKAEPGTTLEALIKAIAEDVKTVKLTKHGVVSLLKETFPSLVYGSDSTGIISADVSSFKDEGAVELAIARENDAVKKTKVASSEIVSQVYPVECKLNTLGCPFFNFSQQYFIDFGTGTSIDNIYGVNTVEHTLSAGEFKTSLSLMQEDTFPVLITPESGIADLLVASLLALPIEKAQDEKK
jgi:hypothetical protein